MVTFSVGKQPTQPPIDLQVHKAGNTSSGDLTFTDPAVQKPTAVPPPGKIAQSWLQQQSQNGAMITGKLFGLNGPFEYEGHGTDVTEGDNTGPASVTITDNMDTVEGTKAMLRREEGFEGAGKWDVDAYRAGYGSDTYTTEDGVIHKVTKGQPVSKDDAERDLDRRSRQALAAAQKAVGPDTWKKLPTKVQIALGDFAYNYGTVFNAQVAAARSGNLNYLADTVQAQGHRPGIQNPGRRNRESNLIRSVA